VAGRPRMVVGWPAHVSKAPPFCPKGVVVELNREIVEGKGEKEGYTSPCETLRYTKSPISNERSPLLLSA
jgi:hypothetical protein